MSQKCTGMTSCDCLVYDTETHQSFCGSCKKALLSEEVGQQVLLCKAGCGLATVPIKYLHQIGHSQHVETAHKLL